MNDSIVNVVNNGKCKFCNARTDDVYYVFCDGMCQEFYYLGVEKRKRINMKVEKIELKEELYKSWLEDEVNKIESMDLAQIEKRIFDLESILFETRTRMAIVHQKRIKLQGSDWIANSKSISAPDFKVSHDKDIRKRPSPGQVRASKEERQENLHKAAGIDKDKLKALVKEMMLAKAKAKASSKEKS